LAVQLEEKKKKWNFLNDGGVFKCAELFGRRIGVPSSARNDCGKRPLSLFSVLLKAIKGIQGEKTFQNGSDEAAYRTRAYT